MTSDGSPYPRLMPAIAANNLAIIEATNVFERGLRRRRLRLYRVHRGARDNAQTVEPQASVAAAEH